MTAIRPASAQDADQLARLRWDFRIEGGTLPSTTLDEFVAEMRSFVGDLLAEGTAWPPVAARGRLSLLAASV